MFEAIKKGFIETAYLSAWCSHAEEYGSREHGITAGCRIEDVAPKVPYADMTDMADRVLSRLAAAFVTDAVFRADCLAAVEWFRESVDWSSDVSHTDEYEAISLAHDYPIMAALLLAAKADATDHVERFDRQSDDEKRLAYLAEGMPPSVTDRAWRLLTTDYADRFGSCLAYELVGAGVAWSDDHADVLPRLPLDSRLEEHVDSLLYSSCTVCALPDHIEATRYNGKLPSFSSVGGYPLLYINARNEGFCAECADKREHKITDVDAHMEGQPFTCDDCGAEIESAYGDPESDDGSEAS